MSTATKIQSYPDLTLAQLLSVGKPVEVLSVHPLLTPEMTAANMSHCSPHTRTDDMVAKMSATYQNTEVFCLCFLTILGLDYFRNGCQCG